MMRKYITILIFSILCVCYFCDPVYAQISLNDLPSLHAIDFVDSLNGWIVGSGGTVLRTRDAGTTWNVFNVGRNDVHLLAVDFINNEEGWVGGQFPYADGIILHTQDGGQTWEVQYEAPSLDFRVITFVDEKHGWAGGVSSGLFYTSDGGKTWKLGKADIRPIAFVMSIAFFDSLNGWAEGTLMPLLNTTDGGRTWNADTVAIAGKKIFFVDSLHGWVMRVDGGVWRTTDGGKSWDYYPVPQTSGWQFLDIFFVDSLVGYLTNEIGTFRCNDGGMAWQKVSEKQTNGIFFTGKDFGWGVNVSNGISRRLAYTSDGARTWNAVVITAVEGSQEIESNPSDITLFPNYPNPFNPETKIRFVLYQRNTHIKLVIFDIQGKEVMTLMDETLPVGSHERRWNGKDADGNTMPSGVYFYQIISKNIKQTKKMLLLL